MSIIKKSKISTVIRQEYIAEIPYNSIWNFRIEASREITNIITIDSALPWQAVVMDWDNNVCFRVRFYNLIEDLITNIGSLYEILKDSYDKKEGKYGHSPLFEFVDNQWQRVIETTESCD